MPETITVKHVYDKISEMEKKMITKEELSEYLETFEVMSNPETMESIRKSREDIKKGRVKKIENVKEILD
jgi:PHD/YefM family antitoxin component YafN of YafNO toxin-antitoxin module